MSPILPVYTIPAKFPLIAIPSTTLQVLFLSASLVLAVSSTIKKHKKGQYNVKEFMAKAGE